MTELLVGAASVDGGHGLNEVLSRAHPHLDAALTSLTVVAERSQRLSPNGLVPQLADAVGKVQKLLEPIQPLLSRSQAFLDLERYFFSTDHRFLLLSQNNAQLRPSGGFIGTYGLVSLGPSGFKLERFEDVYKLPGAAVTCPSLRAWGRGLSNSISPTGGSTSQPRARRWRSCGTRSSPSSPRLRA